jgi:hypothetical protein
MTLIEIIPRTPFTFATTLGVVNEVTLAKYIDTAAFGSAVVIGFIRLLQAGPPGRSSRFR